MNRPFVVTVWRGAYTTLGAFATFAEALALYVTINDDSKQLVNEDQADSGRDGLTDDERDLVAGVAYAEELASRKVAS